MVSIVTSSSPFSPFIFLLNLSHKLQQHPGKGEKNYNDSDIDRVHAHLIFRVYQKENKDSAKNRLIDIKILLRYDAD
jgi:hypothetical protein